MALCFFILRGLGLILIVAEYLFCSINRESILGSGNLPLCTICFSKEVFLNREKNPSVEHYCSQSLPNCWPKHYLLAKYRIQDFFFISLYFKNIYIFIQLLVDILTTKDEKWYIFLQCIGTGHITIIIMLVTKISFNL